MSLLATSEGYKAIFLAARDFSHKKRNNSRENNSEASTAKLSDNWSEWGNTQTFLEEQMISNNKSATTGSKSTGEEWEVSPNDEVNSTKEEWEASPNDKDKDTVLPSTSRRKKHHNKA